MHVVKTLKCSLMQGPNWYLLFENHRCCLSIIYTLREASDPGTCQLFQRHLSQETVCNKDCMAVDPILQLASPEVRDALLHVGDVCHSLVPQRFKPTDDNKAGQ